MRLAEHLSVSSIVAIVTISLTVVGVVLGIVATIFSALSIREYNFARGFFGASAIILANAAALYLVGVQVPEWSKAIFIVSSTSLIGCLYLWALNWIDSKRADIDKNWRPAVDPPPVTQASPSSLVQAAPRLPASVTSDKVFAPITPEELAAFYDEPSTSVEGDRRSAPYKGMWLRVSGKVRNVEARTSWWLVTFEPPVIVQACFDDFARWEGRVSVLRRGHSITFDGQIARVYRGSVGLDNCELVNS